MHSADERKKLILGYQAKVITTFFLVSVFIFLGNLSIAYAGNNIISFKEDKVEEGVPLKIIGAPEGSIYCWTFTTADGTTNTYKSSDNTYTPVASDMETLITVTIEGMEEAAASIYYSSLPVIYIDNTEGYYGVGDDYNDATMSVQGNEKFVAEDEIYSGDIVIRLRGNSTRWREKKPFNIKLDKKSDLLGMGKNKHWALLANDIDHTLMRNKLLYDFSGAIGMDVYSKSEPVILIFNHEYYGVYQLCELVNVGPERVDIYDWEESAEAASKAIVKDLLDKGELTEDLVNDVKEKLEDKMCEDMGWISSPYTVSFDIDSDGVDETFTITDYIELPAVTGGVLIEMDFYAFDGHNPSTMITAYSQPLYFKTPGYAITNESLYENTRKYIQAFEYALHSTDFIYRDSNPKFQSRSQMGGHKDHGYTVSNFTASEYEGKHYSELFDFDSLVEYFMVSELSMNWDSMKNSVFMYKDIDGLFYMGPAWDYDWSWGNINMYHINTWYPTSWHTTEEDFTIEQYYQRVQWNRSLIRDPYFLVRVYEKYQEIRGTIIEEMIKSDGVIDSYAEDLKTAAAANDARWGYTYPEYQSVGFEDSLDNMKNFLQTRITWMDKQFVSLDKFITSIGYYKPSSNLKVTNVEMDASNNYALITAEVIDPHIASLTFQVNGTHMYNSMVESGKAICQIPISDLVKEKGKRNVIQILAQDVQDKYIIDTMEIGNYYNAESNYHVFLTEELTEGNADSGLEVKDSNTEEDSNNTEADGNSTKTGDNNVESQKDLTIQERKQTIRMIFIVIMIVSIGVIMQGIGIVIVFKHRKNSKNKSSNIANNDDQKSDPDYQKNNTDGQTSKADSQKSNIEEQMSKADDKKSNVEE